MRINPQYLHSAGELQQRFMQAQPFRHISLPDFLEPTFVRSLLQDFPGFDSEHAVNESGERGRKAVRMDMPQISANYAELDRLFASASFLGWLSQLTGIPDLLYDPDYIGGGTHENLHGQGLSQHVDFNILPKSGWHRRLNLIIYLNEGWLAEWGGCLELQADPWDQEKNQTLSFLPTLNHCVVFETNEHSWHGFTEVQLPPEQRQRSRKSIAVYFYSRERLGEPVAPAHATIYVPAGMPSGIEPDTLLTEAQWQQLRHRFAQLRGQLRINYRTEYKLSEQLAQATAALAEARSLLAFPLQGYAVIERVSGYFGDGWCEADFSLEFRLTRSAHALRLHLSVPGGLPATQELTFNCAGRLHSERLAPGESRQIELPLPGKRIKLTVQSRLSWVPSEGGQSDDQRPLAWYVRTAELA